jgi:thioredoxin reductase (NADPH)
MMGEGMGGYDAKIAIVGAGPIGLELAVALKRIGADYIHFDAHQIGYTISWWPRDTPFFSTSERVAIAGIPIQSTHHQRITGEEYLAYLRGIVEQFDLRIHTYEPVVDIKRQGDEFVLRTLSRGEELSYRTQYVVLAKGDMDKPNLLGIPGEDLPHVSHRFRRTHDYFRKRLLIVGGRNSAVEAALRCWRAGAEVTLSYRRAEFDPGSVKRHMLPDVLTQIRKGNIGFLPQTVPLEIRPKHVVLGRAADGQAVDGERIVHETDFVLLCTGFVQDMRLYELAGVTLRGPERIPVHDPETMETDVPGLFLAGTTAAGNQGRYTLFIENTHHHVLKIVAAVTGRRDVKIGTIPARTYDLLLSEIRAN